MSGFALCYVIIKRENPFVPEGLLRGHFSCQEASVQVDDNCYMCSTTIQAVSHRFIYILNNEDGNGGRAVGSD